MVTAAAHDIIESGAFTDYRDVVVEETLVNYRNKQIIVGGVKADGTVLFYSKHNQDEIDARIAIEGGDGLGVAGPYGQLYFNGVYANIFYDPSILTDAHAETVANNLLKRHGTVPIGLTFNSDETDWEPSTKMRVDLPTLGIEGATHDDAPIGYTEVVTAADLYNVRNNLIGNYIQMADIDLSGYANWEPIGASFTGIYDGNDYQITGLTINRPTTNNVGLFGAVAGEVKRIKIIDADVTGQDYVGILAGHAEDCYRCMSSGSVAGRSYVGGLVGWHSSTTEEVRECRSTATATGTLNFAGGLIGYSSGNAYNCFATGNVSGAGYVGGLFGYKSGRGTYYGYSVGAVTGTSDVGGLIGAGDSGYTTTSSYYDSTTSGQSDNTGKGTPKTTAEMKQQATFVDWDFTDVWGISASVNDGYPYLLWDEPGTTDTYFLIEEAAIKDLGADILRTYLTATRRSGTDFSTQRTGGFVDYFAKIVRTQKTLIEQSQAVQLTAEAKPDSFTELDDAPASYTGQAGKVVVVNATADGIEFVAANISYYEPLTNGDEDATEILFGSGDVLMGEVS